MKLEENHYYHIYHRGIDKKNIFFSDRDYNHFLSRYQYYLFLAIETYAFCLLKNHIHLLIKVRSRVEQKSLFEEMKLERSSGFFHGLNYEGFKPYSASTQFGHLFNSYTKYFNKRTERTGVLFDGRFKRIKVDSEEYLNQLICYIHRNPIHHRIANNYTVYPHSSYNEILSGEKTPVNRRKVFEIMGDKENFKTAHKEFKMKLDTRFFLED